MAGGTRKSVSAAAAGDREAYGHSRVRRAVWPLVQTQAGLVKRWESLYGKLFYNGAWTETWPAEGACAVRRITPIRTSYPRSPAGTPKIKAAQGTAADFLSRKVHEFPGQVTLIAAGPLTNLALAARLDPQFASLAKELVFMGGSYNPTPSGNGFAAEYANTPRREFNMRWDPEAAHIVLHEAWKHITQVPIDPTTRTFFKPEYIHEVGRPARRPSMPIWASSGSPFPCGMSWPWPCGWIRPSSRSQVRLKIDVSTTFGPNYGDSLSWRDAEAPGLGEQSAQVVFEVDVPKFERMALDLLMAALKMAPPSRLNRVVAVTTVDNQPSIKVLERLGFRFERMVYLMGHTGPRRFFVRDTPPEAHDAGG
jgi:purine nucleosidase